jgi:hypothetical protein
LILTEFTLLLFFGFELLWKLCSLFLQNLHRIVLFLFFCFFLFRWLLLFWTLLLGALRVFRSALALIQVWEYKFVLVEMLSSPLLSLLDDLIKDLHLMLNVFLHYLLLLWQFGIFTFSLLLGFLLLPLSGLFQKLFSLLLLCLCFLLG